MRSWQFVVLALITYAIWSVSHDYILKRDQSKLLAAALKSGAIAEYGIPKNCLGKKYCVTAFIAPWCGVCNSTVPTFKALHNSLPKLRPDVGFGLVIGADSSAENLKKKKELSDIESYTDDTGDIMHR